MVNPQVGFQPRTTPAERRADIDQQRRALAEVAAVYSDPETFTGPIEVNTSTSDPNFVSNKTGAGNVNGVIHVSIRSAGTEIGRITRATSSTAGFLTTSDEDLKENIEPITDDLAMLWMRTIAPYWFNYVGESDVRHVGYLAQRVAADWPNGVLNGIVTAGHGNVADRTWDEDGNETTPSEVWQAWMMDHSKITPILHACLRTLDTTIEFRGVVLEDHEARIAALEETIAAQAAQIEDLRTEIFYTRQMTSYWQYSNTATAPPGAGQMRTNVPITQMYIHRNDTDGYDRKKSLDFLVAATTIAPPAVRFRVRGASGSVFELRTSGIAVDNGTYCTVPVEVVSGTADSKGFRVEITMLTEIWAQDPPPLPTA